MKKRFLVYLILVNLVTIQLCDAHCQMPCGIYHDEMVYDQIDQFVQTVYKGISVLNENKFNTAHERNECVRWIMQKEKCCEEATNTITFYFLQQKIKPDEPDTAKRLISAHKLLFLIVAIKQNTDLDDVKQFNNEWEKFKLMFHQEGYECEMEKKGLQQLEELKKAQKAKAAKTEAEKKSTPQ